MKILSGPLKDFQWTTAMNYEYLTGTYISPDELKIIKKVLDKKEAAFYDIGANVGYYSITVARLLPQCIIFAFEPMPQHLQHLKNHIAINKTAVIQIQNVAVSGISSELVFSNDKNSEGNTYKNQSPLFKKSTSTIKVKSITLDDFVSFGHKPPTLLKIDAEGAELDVLNGAAKTIAKYKPVIMLATHDCHVPGIKNKCKEFLSSMNYRITPIGSAEKYLQGLEDFLAEPMNS